MPVRDDADVANPVGAVGEQECELIVMEKGVFPAAAGW